MVNICTKFEMSMFTTLRNRQELKFFKNELSNPYSAESAGNLSALAKTSHESFSICVYQT